jgi:hypothetical protein
MIRGHGAPDPANAALVGVSTEDLLAAVYAQVRTVRARVHELRLDSPAAALALADVNNAALVLIARRDLAESRLVDQPARWFRAVAMLRPLVATLRDEFARGRIYATLASGPTARLAVSFRQECVK